MLYQNKILYIAALAFLLSGCASKPKVFDKPVLVDRAELVVPQSQPASQTSVEWVILTPSNVEAKMLELQGKGNVSYFALTPQGYQNLSMNVAELRRYIEQQNAVIAAYQKYYKNDNNNQPAKK
jgi:predicted component of type VI protein secretion system